MRTFLESLAHQECSTEFEKLEGGVECRGNLRVEIDRSRAVEALSSRVPGNLRCATQIILCNADLNKYIRELCSRGFNLHGRALLVQLAPVTAGARRELAYSSAPES